MDCKISSKMSISIKEIGFDLKLKVEKVQIFRTTADYEKLNDSSITLLK